MLNGTKTKTLCESYNFTIEEQKDYINSLIEILQPDIIPVTNDNADGKRFVYSDTHGDFIALVGPLIKIGAIALTSNEFVYYDFKTEKFIEKLENIDNLNHQYLVLPKTTRNELFKGEVYILGDFIDRGDESILSLLFLENLINSSKNKKNIFLAIGNHEIDYCNNSQIFYKTTPIINRMITNKILKTGYLIKENKAAVAEGSVAEEPIALWHSVFDDSSVIQTFNSLANLYYITHNKNEIAVAKNIQSRLNNVVKDIKTRLSKISKNVKKVFLEQQKQKDIIKSNSLEDSLIKSINNYIGNYKQFCSFYRIDMRLDGYDKIENIKLNTYDDIKYIISVITNIYEYYNNFKKTNRLPCNFRDITENTDNAETIFNELFKLNFSLTLPFSNKFLQRYGFFPFINKRPFCKQLQISNDFIKLDKHIKLGITFKNYIFKIINIIKNNFTTEELINIKITLGDLFLELKAQNVHTKLKSFCKILDIPVCGNPIFWNRCSNQYSLEGFYIKQYVGHDALNDYMLQGKTTFVDIKRSIGVNQSKYSKISMIDLDEGELNKEGNIIYISYEQTALSPEISQESKNKQTQILASKMKNFLNLKQKYINNVNEKKHTYTPKSTGQVENQSTHIYYELIDRLLTTPHTNSKLLKELKQEEYLENTEDDKTTEKTCPIFTELDAAINSFLSDEENPNLTLFTEVAEDEKLKNAEDPEITEKTETIETTEKTKNPKSILKNFM